MKKRKYAKIQVLEPEIVSMQEAGKTHREIAEHFGLERSQVKKMFGEAPSEKHHYIEPHHGQSILNCLWEIRQAVKRRQYMEIEHERMKGPKCVRRRVQPVGLCSRNITFI